MEGDWFPFLEHRPDPLQGLLGLFTQEGPLELDPGSLSPEVMEGATIKSNDLMLNNSTFLAYTNVFDAGDQFGRSGTCITYMSDKSHPIKFHTHENTLFYTCASEPHSKRYLRINCRTFPMVVLQPFYLSHVLHPFFAHRDI